jgi:Mg-chelatase subunit ChlD
MKETGKQPDQYVITDSLTREAESISLFIGGDYNMSVGLGPWGSGWHWDFVKNHVNMDPKDLATQPIEEVKGVAAHEGNHRLASRTKSVMDLWQNPGFSFGYNAVEDPRANEAGMHFNPGTRKWIRAYIEKDLQPGGGLNYQEIPEETKKNLGYIPDYMKWGAEMIRYWHEKEFKKTIDTEQSKKAFLDQILDASVREAAGKTLDDFEKYYKTIPETKDEMDIQWEAQKASQHFRDTIWPTYQKLVEKSYEDHSMVKMIEDMLKDKDGKNGEGQQGQTGQQGQGQGQGKGKSNSAGIPKDIQDEIDQKGSGGESSDSGVRKIPWDSLSDKVKDAVKKAFENLPDPKQEEYREQAKKELENAEDKANEKLRGKMNDPRYTKTHSEEAKEQEKEARDQEETGESRQSSKDMQKKMDTVTQTIPENPYAEFLGLPDVDKAKRKLIAELKHVFEPTEDPDIRYASSGTSPSMRKAMQSEADPRKINIFERRGLPLEKRYRFVFLIDLSGSMTGRKITETFKALIPIIEALNYFGIETEVQGFSGDLPGTVRIYKSADTKKLDRKTRDAMGVLMSESGGGTPMKGAIQKSLTRLYKRMKQVNIERTYFIPLTDGDPTDCSEEELFTYVKSIRKDRSIVTAGFGIGPDSDYVNRSFPELPREVRDAIAQKSGKNYNSVNNRFDTFGYFNAAFAIIIGYMIRRPELFI